MEAATTLHDELLRDLQETVGPPGALRLSVLLPQLCLQGWVRLATARLALAR